jgi:hypothetical protein
MTDEQRLALGNRAKEVLDNEAFTAAFNEIEQELTQAWKTSPQRDSEGRERLFLALTMLAKVKASLTTTMETGKLALMELEHKKTLAQRAKESLGLN